jgi:hypothetical protein
VIDVDILTSRLAPPESYGIGPAAKLAVAGVGAGRAGNRSIRESENRRRNPR